MKNSGKIKCKVREIIAIFKRSPGNNQDGAALVTILLLLTLLALLTVVAINSSITDATRTEGYKESREAFYIADAGIEHAKSVIKILPFDTVLAASGILDLDGPGDATVNFIAGSYSVVVTDNNDGDGNTADDSDGIVIITSTATTAEGTTKIIVAMIKKFSLEASDFPAAITLADSDAEIDMDSNSFTINGNGNRRDLGPPDQSVDDPTCPDQNGIATNDNAPEESYSPANGINNIVGINGSADILKGDTSFTLAQLQKIRSTYLSLPKVTYNGITNSSDITAGNLGTRANPQITYFDDSLTINGNISGAGILIVDKDFKVKDGLTFEGIILVGICDTCPGRFETEDGNAMIYGAVVVSNPTSSHSDEARLEMTNNASIYYSCQAIEDYAAGLLSGTFSVISWSG